MKLMLRRYLADLKERDELEAILPALLSEMGFNVISKPRRGTRQNGVDVAAVGQDEDDGGLRKVFLFVLKPGDIGRRDWDGGPQSVRPSLDEIQDTYIRSRIPEQFQRLPIAVCLCMGGVLREEVQAQWTGYVEGKTREGLCFRMWNGDKLAELLVTGVLRGELLNPDVQSDFEKSVAMVDHPEVSYRFFRRVTNQLLDGTVEDPRGTTRLRQVYVALWVLFVWARAAENLEAAFRVSEYALIRMWGYCRGSAMTGVLPTGAAEVADQIIGLHLVISTELLNDKVEPHANRQFALSAAVDSQSAVDVNLALFDLLGRISLAGLWWHWRATFVDDADNGAFKSQRDKLMQMAINTISANSALASPIRDDFAIELALFMLLAQVCGVVDNVSSYVSTMANRILYAVRRGRAYPTVAVDYHKLIGHPSSISEEYFTENTQWSILYPLLVAWLNRIDAKPLRDAFVSFLQDELGHTTHQIWVPDSKTDERFWEGRRDHGVGIPRVPLNEDPESYDAFLAQVSDEHPAFEDLSTTKKGLWPILLAACRHFRMPVPPQLWFVGD